MISANRWYASISDVIKRPNEKGRLSSLIFENKNLQLRYYSPKKKDNQIPHEQDEIYLIAKGSGKFVKKINMWKPSLEENALLEELMIKILQYVVFLNVNL